MKAPTFVTGDHEGQYVGDIPLAEREQRGGTAHIAVKVDAFPESLCRARVRELVGFVGNRKLRVCPACRKIWDKEHGAL